MFNHLLHVGITSIFISVLVGRCDVSEIKHVWNADRRGGMGGCADCREHMVGGVKTITSMVDVDDCNVLVGVYGVGLLYHWCYTVLSVFCWILWSFE